MNSQSIQALLVAVMLILVLAPACGNGVELNVPINTVDSTVVDSNREDFFTRTQIVELAITDVQIVISKSVPPRYELIVTATEPSSCQKFEYVQSSFEPSSGSTEIHLSAHGVVDPQESGCDNAITSKQQVVKVKDALYAGTEYTVIAGQVIKRFTGQTRALTIADVLSVMEPKHGHTVDPVEIGSPFFEATSEAVEIGSTTVQLLRFGSIKTAYEVFEVLQSRSQTEFNRIDRPIIYLSGPVIGIQVGESDPVSAAMRTVFGRSGAVDDSSESSFGSESEPG